MKSVQDDKGIKLSDKQKEVIKLMRKGRFIFKNVTYAIMAGTSIRLNTVSSLKNKGIINISKRRDKNGFWNCTLTEPGKTINL